MKNLFLAVKGLFIFKEPQGTKTFTLEEKHEKTTTGPSMGEQKTTQRFSDEDKVSTKLSENLDYMKWVYSAKINSDILIREFTVVVNNRSLDAFVIFIDGMTNTQVINESILKPLMLLSNLNIPRVGENIAKTIEARLITHNQIKKATKYVDVIDEVSFGGCGVFVDSLEVAFAADVKMLQGRSVGTPNTELVIRGPQEGFTEGLRINTGLIRKIIKDDDLIVESVSIGEKSKTPCAVLYMRDIANDELIGEVKRRIKNIDVDNISDSGELEQLIEDASFLPMPQVIATERPDRVASMLIEGKVAIIMHGSPFALVVPCTLPELIHSSEDAYIRFPYINLLRLMRLIGLTAALLLPGVFVAITNYHQELIPTNLLMSIVATREIVPFPIVVELLLMEFAFELIREAGIRIPGPIGPTLGIVAGLVLGQAAVVANIVSPIMIIVVAIAGIGSFTIPNFSLGYALRILKFAYIFLGALAGFLGIALGIFLQGLWFLSAKSFGVPMFSPVGPVTSMAFYNDFTRAPIWKQEKRQDFINPKDERKQGKISRKWLDSKDGDGDE